MNSKYLVPVFIVVASAALAQTTVQRNPPAAQKAGNPIAQASKQLPDEGTRIFQQNCSRCHNTPDGFSPRISGTILRHMRVRASLSKQDEETLLRFFNQ